MVVPEICVSIAIPKVQECIKALKELEFAEVRMDKMQLSSKDIAAIFSQKTRLIATYRPDNNDQKRKRLLISAIEAGAGYIDIELESDESYKKEIIKKAKEYGCKIIVSYHNNEYTPSADELRRIINRCLASEADIVKIACKINSERDNARLMGLLDSQQKMVIVGMGKKGTLTRLIAPFLGSRFTYASLSKGKETADGQITMVEMQKRFKALKSGVLA